MKEHYHNPFRLQSPHLLFMCTLLYVTERFFFTSSNVSTDREFYSNEIAIFTRPAQYSTLPNNASFSVVYGGSFDLSKLN